MWDQFFLIFSVFFSFLFFCITSFLKRNGKQRGLPTFIKKIIIIANKKVGTFQKKPSLAVFGNKIVLTTDVHVNPAT
jgi:hypothetical protein